MVQLTYTLDTVINSERARGFALAWTRVITMVIYGSLHVERSFSPTDRTPARNDALLVRETMMLMIKLMLLACFAYYSTNA